VLIGGVSASEENDEGLLTMVFQQWKKRRRNNCWTDLFSMMDGEEMVDNEKVLNSGVSAMVKE
jgi:hypothetical protein